MLAGAVLGQRNEPDTSGLDAWAAAEITEAALLPLMRGEIVLDHPGTEDGIWSCAVEFSAPDHEGCDQTYRWILLGQDSGTLVRAHRGPGRLQGTDIASRLTGGPVNDSGPVVIPGAFSLYDLIPHEGHQVMGCAVTLSVAAPESHRRLAEMTGLSLVSGGGRRTVSFARVFRVIFRRALVQTSDTRLVPAGGQSWVYKDARPLLKEYAYPRLREHKVLVDVEDLTLDERKQMLYNHLAIGDQQATVKSQMKPFLDYAAEAEPFRPEMAHQLGLRAFTGKLTLTGAGITDFMTHPREYLRDVYEQLGADQQAALALVYSAATNGILSSPLSLDDSQRDIIDRSGGSPAGTTRALQALTGDFLQVTGPPLAEPGWAFRHPTLWEGFASWVPSQAHLLTVVLAGLTDSALLTRVDCEAEHADEKQGILLRVPPALRVIHVAIS